MAKKLQNTEATEKVDDLLSKSTRCACLTTYANDEQIIETLKAQGKAVVGASWILHDKDDKVPHTHLVILSDRSRRLKDYIGWFKGLTDTEGKTINTMAKICGSTSATKKYFTHSDEESKQKGKHQYSDEDIRILEGEGYTSVWEYKTQTDIAFEAEQKQKATEDNNESLLDDIIAGKPMREMARKYGRDFIKNYRSYRAFASEVVLEETGDIDQAMKLQRSAIEDYTATREKDAYCQGIRHAVDLCMERIDNGKDVTTALRMLKQGVSK